MHKPILRQPVQKNIHFDCKLLVFRRTSKHFFNRTLHWLLHNTDPGCLTYGGVKNQNLETKLIYRDRLLPMRFVRKCSGT